MTAVPTRTRPSPGATAFGVAAVFVAATLGGCSDVETSTVAYDPRYGDATSLDVYRPRGAAGRPGLLIVHGGGWRLFDKARYTLVARRFAEAGYVVASANYRLVPEGEFPNAAHDVACALAYLQNHADELGVDRTRIATIGYSAGAHLTALVAVANSHPDLTPDCPEGAPEKQAAVISAAGPMDMLGLADVSIVHDFMGGTPSNRYASYVLASPITHVTSDDPPFLFVHGSHDVFVPIEQSYAMRAALRADGVEANVLELRGGGHIVNASDDLGQQAIATILDAPEAWIAVDAFLARTVGRP